MSGLPSRRDFVRRLGAGAALATTLSPADVLAEAQAGGARVGAPSDAADGSRGAARGLAAAGDFLLDPGLAYLQTASLGPTPRVVMDAVMAHWRELERNPTLFAYGAHEQAMERVRAQAAAFINCAADELVLTGCTTDGMNLVASGLPLERGDHVLTTDQEHPGGRSGWEWLARTRGVALEDVPMPPSLTDPDAIVDAFARRITPRTRVVMVSHVLTSTGLRMPVRALADLARARGCLLVVDGAQAAGGIRVDVRALGCDAYVTSGHKWMLGPKGTGLLYIGARLAERFAPVQLQAGRAAYSASNGVRSLPSVLGLGAAMDYVGAIGTDRVEAHGLAVRERARAGLAALPRLRVVSPPAGPMATPIVTFALPEGITGAQMQQRLHERHRVFVKVVPANFLNGNRISTHLFNTEGDVDRLLAGLAAELG